ncbi:MAG: PEP-utilizing enzyme [Candidatus Woesearchaeota archaeon]
MKEYKIAKLLAKNELDIQKAKAALLICDLVYPAYTRAQPGFGVGMAYFEKGSKIMHQIMLKDYMAKLSDRQLRRFLIDRQLLKRMMLKQNQIAKRIEKICGDFRRFSDKELLIVYFQFLKLARQWWTTVMVLEDKGEVIDRRIVPEIANSHGINLQQARYLVATATHPYEMSIFNRQRLDMLKLVLADESSLDKKLAKYVAKYFWIKSDFYKAGRVDAKTVRSDMAEVAIKSKIDIKKEINNIKNNLNHICKERKKALKSFGKEENQYIQFGTQLNLFLDIRKAEMMKQFYHFSNLITEICRRKKIRYEDLAKYLTEEVESLLRTGKRLPVGDVKKRSKGIFMIYDGKNKTMYCGTGARKLFSMTEKAVQGQVKGLVASTGTKNKVRGICRVVLNPESAKFSKGEILITSMTRVEFMPLMRLARAVITDEGGISSHAAIISRELGIPCIIGSKNATRQLRNGDKVTLNMKTGEVTII